VTPAPLEAGTILPLVRELSRDVDPLALYAALTDGGTRPDTFLLESAGNSGGSGERSVIGVSSALRITARGRVVSVDALSPNGRSLLPWAESRLADTGGAVSASATRLLVETPAPPPGALDEAERRGLPSPFDALRAIVFGPQVVAPPTDACHLAAGLFAYDLIELFEELPSGPRESDPTPHFEWMIPDRLVIVDHARHRTLVVANAYGGAGNTENYNDATRAIVDLVGAIESLRPAVFPPPASGTATSVDLSDAAYADLVRALKSFIVSGDVFQIVASRTYSHVCADSLGAYARLRAANPSPYLFFVRGAASTVFGASPETALKVHGRPRRVTIRPIAGTAPRGADPDLDARREVALRLDAKETAEHMMLVDLARNDIARVSRPGTRRVTRLLSVDRYAHVMHLVSEVEGELDPSLDALHAYGAAMNMGTLVGAPKIRAAQILREVEPSRRGAYGGAVGYLTGDGSMDTAIVIRAAVVRDGIARVRAGAGIVIDSDPDSEALETRRKAEALLRAIAGENADA
jgi:anthranilate synthase component 1